MSQAPRLHRHHRSSSKRRGGLLRLALATSSLIVMLLSAGVAFRADTPAVAVAPGVTATLTVAPSGAQLPGTQLDYVATISNTGASNATGVQFNIPIDPNTTLVTNTFKASPNASAQAYNAVCNTPLTVAAGSGLKVGAFDIDLVTIFVNLNVTAVTNFATAHGHITTATDGSFTYTPNTGFASNTDTFTYTITDGDGLISTAIATFTVGNCVWWVDGTYGGGSNDGSFAHPFTTTAPVSAVDHANDTIFVYNHGSYNFNGGLTLKAGEQLIGNGVAFTAGSVSVPAAGNAVLSGSGVAAGVALATNNTISGVTINDSGSAAKVSGSSFGTLTMSTDTLSGTGQAMALTNGTLAITSTGLASTSSVPASVTFTSVGGSASFSGTTISNGLGQGIFVTTSTADVDFGNTSVSGATLEAIRLENNSAGTRTFGTLTITNGSDRGLMITNAGGQTTVTGTTTITNPASDGILIQGDAALKPVTFANVTVDKSGTSAGVGVFLGQSGQTNVGAVTFAKLDITAATGQRGLWARTNTGTITTTSGTITAPTNTAIEIDGTSSVSTTPLNMTLTSVSSASSAAPDGIILTNTSGTGFSIVGTGSAGTGGTIANKTGADGSTTQGTGIYLNTVANVSLAWMQLNDFQNFGIDGTDVTGFALAHTVVSGTNGTNQSGLGEGDIYFTGLSGSATVSNSTFSGAVYDTFHVFNNNSQSLNRITFTNCSFGSTNTLSNDALVFQGTGGTLNVTVQDSTFTAARGDLFQIDLHGTISSDLVFGGVGHGNTLSNNNPNILSGGGGVTLGGGGAGQVDTFTFNISNNTFRDAVGSAIGIGAGTGAGTNHNYSGTINANTIGVPGTANSGSSQGSGIGFVFGDAGTGTVSITNNNVYQYNNEGILLNFGAFGGANSYLSATVTGNTISNPGSFGTNGVLLTAGTQLSPIDKGKVCLALTGNTIAGSGANGGSDARIRDRFDVKVGLPGYAGASTDGAAAAAFLVANNGGVPTTASAPNPASGTTNGTTNGFFGSCPPPLLAASGGVGGPPVTDAALPSVAPVPVFDAPAFASPVHVAVSVPPAPVEPAGARSIVTGRVTQPQLPSLVAEARLRWLKTGLSLRQMFALYTTAFEVADLPANYLGQTEPGHVSVSSTAGGYGWFIDGTPADDTEFGRPLSATRLQTSPVELPAGHYDLLTALMHEMGHVLGIEDRYDTAHRDDVMYGYLVFGERRLPAAGEAQGYRAGSRTTTDMLLPPYNIQTLTPGTTVQIKFSVTINNPTPATQVSFQGTVSGSNFSSVLTDDPSVGGATDPTVTVVLQPDLTASKVNTVSGTSPLGGTWQWQTTVANGGNASAIFTSGQVIFRDALPTNGVAYSALGTSNSVGGISGTISCGFNPANTIECTASGASVTMPAGSSFRVNVTATPSTAGDKTNAAAGCMADPDLHVAESNESNNNCAANTVNVVAPASMTKAFAPTSIAPSGQSTLSFTITNPAANTVAETSLTFTDVFPAGMTVANLTTADTCGGTLQDSGGGALAVGSAGIKLAGGTSAAPGANCTVSVNVTTATGGANLNTSGIVSSTNGGNGNTATATLTVANPPTIAKAFGAASIQQGASTLLTITITNPVANGFGLTGVAFSDSLPSGLVVATPNNLNSTCNGTPTANGGSGTVSLSGGTIGQNTFCTVTLNVTGTGPGVKANTTGTVSSTESGPGAVSNTANLNVFAPPTVTKGFAPTSVAVGGSASTLTIIITNPAANPAGAVTGVAISDSFPGGVAVAGTPNATNSCGGSYAPVAAATSISLTGGTIATAGGSCTITVDVIGSTPGAKNNVTGTVSSAEGGTGLTANATLNVFTTASVTKAFLPTGIAVGGTSTLTITITNPATNPGALNGLGISDPFPLGMEVAAVPGAASTCGGTFVPVATATTITLSGGSIATPGNSCSLSVSVKGTTAGVKNNLTGNVSSTNGGVDGTAQATLTVAASPTIAKAFGAATIPLNGSTTLTFTITNPAANTFSLTGVSFSDSLPAGLVVSTPNGLTALSGCGGVTATGGTGVVSLSGATILQNGTCSFAVNVTGTTAGVKSNTTGAVSSTESGTGAPSNTASITVVAPPTIAKAFGAPSIPLGGSTTLTITLANPNTTVPLTAVAFSDTLPAGLVISTPNGAGGSCTGTLTNTQGTNLLALSGGNLGVSPASCTVIVNVTATTAGAKVNTTGTVSSLEGGTGLTATATLNSFAPPAVAKSFSPTAIPLNGSSTLTITFTNPAANPGPLAGIGISDGFPAGMEVAAPATFTNSCGGTFVPVAAATTITFTGGSIAAPGANCAITVVVKGTTSGQKVNTTGAVSSTNGGTGGTATATLSIGVPPAMTKSFGTASIGLLQTTSLTLTVSNPPANTIALTGVTFTDTLPAGLAVATPNGLIGSCGAGVITATAGSGSVSLSGAILAVNGACSFSLNVTGTALGAQNNSVSATANESGAATVKSGTPALQIAGGNVTWTVTVANPTGPSPATTVSLSDALPANSVFISNTGSAGWGCLNPPVNATGTITCTNASFAVGATSTFTIVVKINAGTAPGTVISNTATIGSATFDPNPANNSATATVTVATPSQAIDNLKTQINGSTAQSQYKLVMTNQLQSAQTYLSLHTTYGNQAACAVLNSFKMLATLYSTIPSTGITPAMAADWNAQVDLIRAAIPC